MEEVTYLHITHQTDVETCEEPISALYIWKYFSCICTFFFCWWPVRQICKLCICISSIHKWQWNKYLNSSLKLDASGSNYLPLATIETLDRYGLAMDVYSFFYPEISNKFYIHHKKGIEVFLKIYGTIDSKSTLICFGKLFSNWCFQASDTLH